MSRRTDEQRIASYNDKVVPANVSAKVTAQLDNMHGGFTAFVNDFVPKQEDTKEILDAANIVPMKYGVYYAFAARLWKLTHTASGTSAANEAEALITLYVARGLQQTVLQDIRTNVFNIAAPTAP